jgi:hypothetical protein
MCTDCPPRCSMNMKNVNGSTSMKCYTFVVYDTSMSKFECVGEPGDSMDKLQQIANQFVAANPGAKADRCMHCPRPNALPNVQQKAQVCPPLNCAQQVQKIVDYYNTRGEWAGKFTMQAPSTRTVGPNACDVFYTGKPVSDGYGGSQQDNRRFTLISDANCNWDVTKMGAHMSGSAAAGDRR